MYNIKILCKLIKNIEKFAYKNMVTIIIINEKKVWEYLKMRTWIEMNNNIIQNENVNKKWIEKTKILKFSQNTNVLLIYI